MERLPEDATLQNRLERGEIDPALMATLADKIAHFHASAETGPHISAFGRYEVVAKNARENFEQAASLVGVTISRAVFDRLRTLTDEALSCLRHLIEARATGGVPRDTHGDLHLDHVYLFPKREPPADFVIIDCIEFNERFRYADPVADMAFLAMDLAFHGRRDLAKVFTESYFRAAGDEESRALLSFYVAYRAAIRGKVEGFELAEKEIPEAERAAALMRARAHWLLALGELEAPGRKPCLILIGGLPGTGKSTLAAGLAQQAGCRLIRSDLVRKELAGLSQPAPAPSPFEEGIYAPAWTDSTYGECLRRAERLLFNGERVIMDASFGEEERRRAFLDAAARLAVPALFLLCRASPDVARLRLQRRRGDASDADPYIYQRAAERWEDAGPLTEPVLREISADAPQNQVLSRALEVLHESGVL
jgi:predicted kinase